MGNYYLCSKCDLHLPADERVKRSESQGFVCPNCGTGLRRKPTFVIHEERDLAELSVL